MAVYGKDNMPVFSLFDFYKSAYLIGHLHCMPVFGYYKPVILQQACLFYSFKDLVIKPAVVWRVCKK